MSTQNVDISSIIEQALKNNPALANPKPVSTEDKLLAEIAKLQAEQAELTKGKPSKKAAKKPQSSGDSATAAPDLPWAPSPFAGTYPDNATPQDRVILEAIHTCRSKPRGDGKTPAAFGKAVYCYLHEGLRVKYAPTPSADPTKTWDWTKADSVLNPAVKSAEERGIITRFQVNGHMLYFDAREESPRIKTGGLTEAQKAAISAAF